MTTTQIAAFADPTGLAAPDLDLQVLLRRKIVPAFCDDVKYPAWRRRVKSIDITGDSREYELPDDFSGPIRRLMLNGTDPVHYIGDDDDQIIAFEAEDTPGQPTGYYLVAAGTPLKYRYIRLNCTPDQAYTLWLTYYLEPVFEDDSTPVDLDQWIPTKQQWTIVEGLKRDIYEVRLGLNDPRFAAATAAYERGIIAARAHPEQAKGEKPKFIR